MVSLVKIPAELQDDMWRDAYRIAWVGASNPIAVAGALAKHSRALTHMIGTKPACGYPALRAIAGHLAFLFGQGLGPDMDLLNLVKVNAQRLNMPYI